jgi:hypothetical protein
MIVVLKLRLFVMTEIVGKKDFTKFIFNFIELFKRFLKQIINDCKLQLNDCYFEVL